MRNQSKHLFLAAALCGSALAPACTCIARGPEQYRDDTRQVLQTRSDAIKTCYDQALTTDGGAQGTVTVNFTVQKKTGNFTAVELDEARSSAPAPLAQCVMGSLEGLVLDPVDQRDGLATFTWAFTQGGGKPAA